MNKTFLITTHPIVIDSSELRFISLSQGYYTYIDRHSIVFKQNDITIIIFGSLLPRNDYFQEYQSLDIHQLVFLLYYRFKEKFINYIKGNFLIILITELSTEIYSDHFGLQHFYIYKGDSYYAIGSSVDQFKHLKIRLEIDIENVAMRNVFNRIPAQYTLFRFVTKTLPATRLIINNGSLNIEQYWISENLLALSKESIDDISLSDFALLIKTNFRNFLVYNKPETNVITLTGGKDSRTGVAALKANDIVPWGFSYGNPLSRDPIYAGKLADALGIPYYIFNPPDSEDYFKECANAIMNYGNLDVSIQRSHRLYAFKEMSSLLSRSSAYYGGYMGGEFLMGVYYDDLIFTKYLTGLWQANNRSLKVPDLKDCFHKTESLDLTIMMNRISMLRCLDPSCTLKERQLYGIFEIGIPHHSQDIYLAGKYFDFVYPFFIDIDLLEALFKSRFSFLHLNNRTQNLVSRYKLFEFNLKIQHLLCPSMDNVPFGKQGTYNTNEFLRGRYYWSILRVYRYLSQRSQYPVTYSYGHSFRTFVLKNLLSLQSDRGHILHQYFDIKKAISALNSIKGNTVESPTHKFTNIVMLYRLMDSYS